MSGFAVSCGNAPSSIFAVEILVSCGKTA
eukprot:COSAG03_NODE_29118_length_190_cov_12.659341_1_plen_28_part_01